MRKSWIAVCKGERQDCRLYATAFKIIVLFFTVNRQVSSATPYSNSPVAKCCPLGQVFSVSENFTCAYSRDSTRELYRLTRDRNENESSGNEIFSCNVTGGNDSLTITALNDIVESRMINGPLACLDFLYDGGNIPVILECKQRRVDDEIDDGNESSLPVPRLSNVRVCCEPGFFFHVKTKKCVKRIRDIDISEYFHRFFDKSIEFLTVYRGIPTCEYAILDYIVNVTEYPPRSLNDGNFEIVVSTKNGTLAIVASEKNSCVDPVDGEEETELMAVRLCSGPTYCKKNSCVRKCCPEGEVSFFNDCRKIKANASAINFNDALLDASRERGLAESVEYLATSDYGLLIGNPCKNRQRFLVYPDEGWHMNPRGAVFVPDYRLYEHDDYCTDIFYMNPESDGVFLPSVCFDSPGVPGDNSSIRFDIQAALELVSCGFLLLTLLVYICLPALQNLHGKTLMCHVSSLIVAYLSTAAVALQVADHPDHSETRAASLCKFLGFTVLLSWIAAFSWLNVMCFDIWWTFGGLGRAAVPGGRSRAYRKRFFVYSLYAWGLPLSITSFGVAADFTESLPRNFRPNMGTDTCWFEPSAFYYGEIVFFLVPVSVQLMTNIGFFILTAIHCSRVKAEISRVMSTPGDSKNRRFRADRTKLIMNIKLFTVMGVTWIFEAISAVINHYAVNLSWRNEFFYVPDAINCLQGVLIFMLFVLKKKVYHALRRRLAPRTSNAQVTNKRGHVLQDPRKVRKSVSSSTIVSTFAVSSAPL